MHQSYQCFYIWCTLKQLFVLLAWATLYEMIYMHIVLYSIWINKWFWYIIYLNWRSIVFLFSLRRYWNELLLICIHYKHLIICTVSATTHTHTRIRCRSRRRKNGKNVYEEEESLKTHNDQWHGTNKNTLQYCVRMWNRMVLLWLRNVIKLSELSNVSPFVGLFSIFLWTAW